MITISDIIIKYTVKMGCCLYLMPLGYSNFVAIETFDVVTRVQGSHGNVTTTPRSVNITIGCYGNTYI